MTASPRAADLPDGSIVVDDLRGLAWYADKSATPRRWRVTGVGTLRAVADHEVDAAIGHGAELLRYGGPETARETEVWAAELTGPDGDSYSEADDRKHAELVADSVATYLAAVAANPAEAFMGRPPDVTTAAVVRRIRRVFPDGSEYLTAWQHIRDGVPVED